MRTILSCAFYQGAVYMDFEISEWVRIPYVKSCPVLLDRHVCHTGGVDGDTVVVARDNVGYV